MAEHDPLPTYVAGNDGFFPIGELERLTGTQLATRIPSAEGNYVKLSDGRSATYRFEGPPGGHGTWTLQN